MSEFLVIAGLSGAGRSTAAAIFEDLGWFVIDNLPPALITKVAELAERPAPEAERIALVVGRGGGEHLDEVTPALDSLRAAGAAVRMVFLEAEDDVLVRRFEGTRRRHPLDGAVRGSGEGVVASIAAERELLGALKDRADVVLDTTDLNIHQLRERLVELFDSTPAGSGMCLTVVSFGFKHGIPLDADLVLDCRFLPNPHWVEELRPLTGLDGPVRDMVLGHADTKELLARLEGLFSLMLPAYAREGKSYLTVGLGCTGGRHRSVVLAEELAAMMAAQGYRPRVHHRDLDR